MIVRRFSAMRKDDVVGARLMHPDEWPLVLDMMRRSGEVIDEACLQDLVVFVLPDGLRLGGFATLTLRPSHGTPDVCRSAHLAGCFVEPDLQVEIGKTPLLDALETWARDRGAEDLTVTVPIDSDADLAEYRHAGFERRRRLQELRKDLMGLGAAKQAVEIELYSGPRESLRSLFGLAEDSRVQLDSYMHLGRVLVAVSGREIVGHLQLVDTDDPSHVELKNMAVHEALQGQGIGAELVEAAVRLLARESVLTLLVATAAADVGNLRFYQRQGFRLRSVERNAFTPSTGYPPGIRIDGIELRDRVWLDRPVLLQ
jgi:GNAT superfamily N-acetyltransferase